MNNRLIQLCAIKILLKSEISSDMSDVQIISLSQNKPEIEVLPGSIFLGIANNQSTAGRSYKNQLSFVVPGQLDPTLEKDIAQVGAFVLTTHDHKNIVIHKHDGMFQNTSLKPSVDAGPQRTQITLEHNTLNYLTP